MSGPTGSDGAAPAATNPAARQRPPAVHPFAPSATTGDRRRRSGRAARWARRRPRLHGRMNLPAAKPKDFKASFRRLLGELRPERPQDPRRPRRSRVVSVLFAIIGPKILGKATNIIFAGVVGKQICPAGLTIDQVVGRRSAPRARDNLADMLAEHAR